MNKGLKTFLITLSILLVLAGIGLAVYAGIIRPVTKPNPTTTQNAERLVNNYINPKPEEVLDLVRKEVKQQKKRFFLGVILFGYEIGIGK